MGTWVLIMSWALGYGNSINSVPGFTSQEICQKAGEQWKESVNFGIGAKARFVCVSTSK